MDKEKVMYISFNSRNLSKKIATILLGVLIYCVNVMQAAPNQPAIASPTSGAGNTYDNYPFIIVSAVDKVYNINDIRVEIDNNSAFLTPNYDNWASRDGTYAEFSDLGTGSDLNIRHRIQSSFSNGTWYVRAMVWNDNTSDRASSWSATCTMTISADPSWTDSTITPGTTLIKAAHFNELKTAIDNVRSFRGSGAFTYTNLPVSSGDLIRVADINDLRDALTAPYNEATGSNPTFTSPDPMTSGSRIKGDHVTELRSDVLLP